MSSDFFTCEGLYSGCIDILIVFVRFLLTKCQNEKCRQKTQNRVSDGISICAFRGKNNS